MGLIKIDREEKKFYKVIISYIGLLSIYTGFALLIPLIFLVFFPEEIGIAFSFLLSSFFSLTIGYSLWRYFRIDDPPTFDIRHSTIIVTFGWILAVVFGALPFFLSGEMSGLDSVFEAFSGWTTTGLTMVVNENSFPRLLLFWRSLMQFIGGAGLAVLMLTAIVGSTDIESGLFVSEGGGNQLLPSVANTAKLIAKIYVFYVLIGSILYIFAGMNWFSAINHSMCAFATGGFSTQSNSIGAYPLQIHVLTIFFMFLGNVNFALHYEVLKGNLKELFLDIEPKLFYKVIVVSIPLVLFSIYGLRDYNISSAFIKSAFQCVSALTGTGYMTEGSNVLLMWGGGPILILSMLMLIGASTGSTGGGLKQLRVSLILKSIYWEIKERLLPKRAVIDTSIRHIGEKISVEKKQIWSVSTFTSIFLLYYLLGVLGFLFYGYNMEKSLFEMASALGTVGLTLGVTGPNMPNVLKVIEIFGMWLGRLEFWTIFVGFISVFKDLGGG